MRCIRRIGGALAMVLVAGCSPTQPPAPAQVALPPPPRPATDAGARPAPTAAPKSLADLRLQAARRIRSVNGGDRCYDGVVPPLLLGIPVLEVELNADGSVKHIDVVRKPSNPKAYDTIKLATEAVHRAAPYGDVSRLPKPWKFTETFLFTDDRKFKLRTLDG